MGAPRRLCSGRARPGVALTACRSGAACKGKGRAEREPQIPAKSAVGRAGRQHVNKTRGEGWGGGGGIGRKCWEGHGY